MHRECKDKLDKTCSDVSEGCMGRKGEGAIKLGVVREWESEGKVTVCACLYVCLHVCICICMCECAICVCVWCVICGLHVDESTEATPREH